MEPPHSTIEFVRPGRASHAWIASTVGELKGGDPLAPVTLVVPNYYAGRQIRWTLAAQGGTNGDILEGAVDFLYADAAGSLHVVDYKTDHITEPQIATRSNEYRSQGEAYAKNI